MWGCAVQRLNGNRPPLPCIACYPPSYPPPYPPPFLSLFFKDKNKEGQGENRARRNRASRKMGGGGLRYSLTLGESHDLVKLPRVFAKSPYVCPLPTNFKTRWAPTPPPIAPKYLRYLGL